MRAPFVLRVAAAAFAVVAMFAVASGAQAESVMTVCASQWKAAQAAGTSGGATWPEFLAKCKSQVSQPSSAGMAPALGAGPRTRGK